MTFRIESMMSSRGNSNLVTSVCSNTCNTKSSFTVNFPFMNSLGFMPVKSAKFYPVKRSLPGTVMLKSLSKFKSYPSGKLSAKLNGRSNSRIYSSGAKPSPAAEVTSPISI